MGFSKIDDHISDINVTPFVDVMLVLLIIFMVTAPLMQRSLNIELPKANASAMKYKEQSMMLTINREGAIQLEGKPIALKNLRKKLMALGKNNKDMEVYLSADHRVSYGYVIKVMDVIKGSGITRLGMVTNPETEIVKKKQAKK